MSEPRKLTADEEPSFRGLRHAALRAADVDRIWATLDAERTRSDRYKLEADALAVEVQVHKDECTAARAKLAEAERERDGAYHERNLLALLLAAVCGGSIQRASDASPGWQNVVLVNTREGQASFHLADHEFEYALGCNIGISKNEWDGHTNEEKWDRIKRASRGPQLRDELSALRAEVARLREAACLNESRIGLHQSLHAIYVVDGYHAEVLDEQDNVLSEADGEALLDAIRAALAAKEGE